VQTRATHELSLVAGAGKRFESARRLSIFPAISAKTKSSDVRVGGFVSSRLSQRLVHAVGGVPSHVGYPVRVAIKSHGYAGVPQKVLNQFRVEQGAWSGATLV
jgi:hypothetical protein